jgi:catechol 2,3-dioxygenase-like lactoylglutathione lyase family enzyme
VARAPTPHPLGDAPLVAFAATTDLTRSHAFYADLLGLAHVETTPFANVYDAAGTMLRVTLVDRVAAAPYTVLGWTVPDIAAVMEELMARGIVFERYDGVDQDPAGVWTAPSGARIAWFRDPDGNVLSLTQPARMDRHSGA